MKPIAGIDNSEVIQQAVGYFNAKPDKNLNFMQSEKEESGLLQKMLNFVTEKMVPANEKTLSSLNSEKASEKTTICSLSQALEDIEKVIQVVRNCIDE